MNSSCWYLCNEENKHYIEWFELGSQTDLHSVSNMYNRNEQKNKRKNFEVDYIRKMSESVIILSIRFCKVVAGLNKLGMLDLILEYHKMKKGHISQ